MTNTTPTHGSVYTQRLKVSDYEFPAVDSSGSDFALFSDGLGQLYFGPAGDISGLVGGGGTGVDDRLARWDGSENIQSSTVSLTDAGAISGITDITATGTPILSGLTYPTSDGTNGQYVSTDGAGSLTFTSVGDASGVIGGAGVGVDNRIVRWDGSENIQSSTVTLTDAGAISGITDITATGTPILSGLTYPTTDGTNGQYISTDGAGSLTFTSVGDASGVIGGAGLGVDNQIVRWDGSENVQSSVVNITDGGNVWGIVDLSVSGSTIVNNFTTTGTTIIDGVTYPSGDGPEASALSTDSSGNLYYSYPFLRTNVEYANLGMTVDSGAGTITMHDACGNALSATNPAYIRANLAGNGLFWAPRTSNASISVNDMSGNNFGLVDGVDYTALIMYVGAVADATEQNPTFYITREPHPDRTPPAGTFATPISPVANGTLQSGIMFENVTVANYANDFRMQTLGTFIANRSAANVWSLNVPSIDGLGMMYSDRWTSLGDNQYGAAANSLFKDNGGTAPIVTVSQTSYFVTATREQCKMFGTFCFAGTGVGAVPLTLATPYPVTEVLIPLGICEHDVAGNKLFGQVMATNTASANEVNFIIENSGTFGNAVVNNNSYLVDNGYCMSYNFMFSIAKT